MRASYSRYRVAVCLPSCQNVEGIFTKAFTERHQYYTAADHLTVIVLQPQQQYKRLTKDTTVVSYVLSYLSAEFSERFDSAAARDTQRLYARRRAGRLPLSR